MPGQDQLSRGQVLLEPREAVRRAAVLPKLSDFLANKKITCPHRPGIHASDYLVDVQYPLSGCC